MDDVKRRNLELIHQIAVDTRLRRETVAVIPGRSAHRFGARHLRAACHKQGHGVTALLRRFAQNPRMHFQVTGIRLADGVFEMGDEANFHVQVVFVI